MLSNKELKILQKDRIITYFPFMLSFYKDIQLAIACHNPENAETMEFITCLNFSTLSDWYFHYSSKYPRLWDILGKITSSNYKKRQRVLKRFENMFENCFQPIYFGTLTFRDEVLENTSQKTRRVYVRRFLKDISFDYLANIDFGDLNSREHYHTIFACDDIEKFKIWKYGFVNVKCVRYDKSSVKHISQYVVKLVNHCVKGSAGFLIASRKRSCL